MPEIGQNLAHYSIVEKIGKGGMGAYISQPNMLSGPGLSYYPWDVSPDGKRFLMLKEAGAADSTGRGAPKINVVLNWLEELKQKAPGNEKRYLIDLCESTGIESALPRLPLRWTAKSADGFRIRSKYSARSSRKG